MTVMLRLPTCNTAPPMPVMGGPAKSIRLIAGLLILKHVCDLSGERVVEPLERVLAKIRDGKSEFRQASQLRDLLGGKAGGFCYEIDWQASCPEVPGNCQLLTPFAFPFSAA